MFTCYKLKMLICSYMHERTRRQSNSCFFSLWLGHFFTPLINAIWTTHDTRVTFSWRGMRTGRALSHTYSIFVYGYLILWYLFLCKNILTILVINLPALFWSTYLHLHKTRRMMIVIEDKSLFQSPQITHTHTNTHTYIHTHIHTHITSHMKEIELWNMW